MAEKSGKSIPRDAGVWKKIRAMDVDMECAKTHFKSSSQDAVWVSATRITMVETESEPCKKDDLVLRALYQVKNEKLRKVVFEHAQGGGVALR